MAEACSTALSVPADTPDVVAEPTGSVVAVSVAAADESPWFWLELTSPEPGVVENGVEIELALSGVLPIVPVTVLTGVRLVSRVAWLVQRSNHSKEADRTQIVKIAANIPIKDQPTALNQAGRPFFAFDSSCDCTASSFQG